VFRVRHDLDLRPPSDALFAVQSIDGTQGTAGGTHRFHVGNLRRTRDRSQSRRFLHAPQRDIEVQLPSAVEKTDAGIATSALNALKWSSSVPDEHIKVSVSKGWVTLEGSVEWNYQREAAEKVVEELIAVKGVTNRISVSPHIKSREVKHEIKAALHRYAELESRNIEVEATDSTVTLRGSVRSWAERKEAENAAWMAPGVTQVKNEIVVSV
jgi:osmotically-inducible protein OsmY